MKTGRCIECGTEATLWFGFASGCRYNGGSHQKFEEIETTIEHERNKLRAAYSCCMYFDRANYEKYAPKEIKDLLIL